MIKNKNLILKLAKSISLALATVIVAVFAVGIFDQKISKISETIKQKRQLSEILKNRNQVMANLRENFKNIGNYDQKIINALVSVDDVTPFVDEVGAIAKNKNILSNLSLGSPTPVNSDGDIKLLSINYTVSLSNVGLSTFIGYLSEFEKMPYFASVDNINIVSYTPTGWDNMANISISGKFYARQ